MHALDTRLPVELAASRLAPLRDPVWPTLLCTRWVSAIAATNRLIVSTDTGLGAKRFGACAIGAIVGTVFRIGPVLIPSSWGILSQPGNNKTRRLRSGRRWLDEPAPHKHTADTIANLASRPNRHRHKHARRATNVMEELWQCC